MRPAPSLWMGALVILVAGLPSAPAVAFGLAVETGARGALVPFDAQGTATLGLTLDEQFTRGEGVFFGGALRADVGVGGVGVPLLGPISRLSASAIGDGLLRFGYAFEELGVHLEGGPSLAAAVFEVSGNVFAIAPVLSLYSGMGVRRSLGPLFLTARAGARRGFFGAPRSGLSEALLLLPVAGVEAHIGVGFQL